MLDRGTKKGIQKLGLPRYDADYTIILFDEASELSADHLHMVKSAVRLNAKTLIVGLANPYFPYSPSSLIYTPGFAPREGLRRRSNGGKGVANQGSHLVPMNEYFCDQKRSRTVFFEG